MGGLYIGKNGEAIRIPGWLGIVRYDGDFDATIYYPKPLHLFARHVERAWWSLRWFRGWRKAGLDLLTAFCQARVDAGRDFATTGKDYWVMETVGTAQAPRHWWNGNACNIPADPHRIVMLVPFNILAQGFYAAWVWFCRRNPTRWERMLADARRRGAEA